jgi:nicotinate phosphoribosyltransferase
MAPLTYVVGHDGSRRAADALAFAARLARATGARLVLVRVRETPRGADAAAGRDEGDEAARLREVADAAAPDVDASARVVAAASAARGLQHVAAAEHAALIVVAATRRMGETAGVGAELVRGARCPIAVVPAGWAERATGVRPVACAFDGSATARPALSVARGLAADLGEPLRVVGVIRPFGVGEPEGERDAMRRRLADAVAAFDRDLAAEIVVAGGGTPGEVLADVSADADILVTGARSYGVDGGAFDPSVSRHLVGRAACPVVVVPLAAARPPARPAGAGAVAADPGLLTAAGASLLIDQYELTMAQSYLRRGMNDPSVFELFVRHLPGDRRWLLVAGLGPALSLVRDMRFGPDELAFLARAGFDDDLLAHLERFRFTGDIDAMPEGTVAFADEPLVRVVAPRIEAQLLETLLLNQINFQTAIATKAARIALAAGDGRAAGGARIVDFSPRRDHGLDAAMKVARCAHIAGAAGTSCVAAAMRYGLRPVGTMAHAYVLSFPSEEEAFRAFLEDNPQNAVLLVDTYDTIEGVRAAIRAARETGVPLLGVRLDSGDLLALSREARRLLDEAGMREAQIVASGDLEEHQIARLVAAGAPIDMFGVGTELGTSRDAPALGGVYKLVADRPAGADGWHPTAKRSPGKATLPWPKQVFRRYEAGTMVGDLLTRADAVEDGEPLLVPAMRAGEIVLSESLDDMRARAARSLDALPEHLRRPGADGPDHPVVASPLLTGARPGSDAVPEAGRR